MTAAAQQRVEGVAFHAFQPISPQSAIVLHAPDRRLDGAATPDVAAQALGDVAFEFVMLDLRAGLHVGAMIAQVHKHILGLVLGKRPAHPPMNP